MLAPPAPARGTIRPDGSSTDRWGLVQSDQRRRLPSALRALTHRNFRLYLAGQGTSIIGSWMQQVAMAWLTYQLTSSPLWLGMVGLAGQIPALFLTPLAGSVIDRTDRRRLLYLTQTVALCQAGLMALLTLTGAVAAWQILVLSLLLGIVNAFDIPTRQSFLSELVGKREDLANAIALNSSVFNGARLVGPALACLLLALTSAGICFLVNAITYLAVLAALRAMRLPQRPQRPMGGHLIRGVREGMAYAWRSAPIRSLLLLIALFNLAGMAETTLLPVVATTVLDGDSTTLALLAASAGVGALAAAVFLASRRHVGGLDRWIPRAPMLFGLSLTAFSFTDTLWAASLLLIATGFALLLLTAAANTLLQTVVEEEKRGRVMSLYTMAVTGLAPIGGLLAGLLAERIGAAPTLRLAGVACLAGAVAFAMRFPHASSCGSSMSGVLTSAAGRPAAEAA
jgi:MFS family permease